jgi:hypothetical protein
MTNHIAAIREAANKAIQELRGVFNNTCFVCGSTVPSHQSAAEATQEQLESILRSLDEVEAEQKYTVRVPFETDGKVIVMGGYATASCKGYVLANGRVCVISCTQEESDRYDAERGRRIEGGEKG